MTPLWHTGPWLHVDDHALTNAHDVDSPAGKAQALNLNARLEGSGILPPVASQVAKETADGENGVPDASPAVAAVEPGPEDVKAVASTKRPAAASIKGKSKKSRSKQKGTSKRRK